MMSEVEDLKQQRKIAKRVFTCALKKLDTSLTLCLDTESLKEQANTLETSYDKLLSVHLEYLDALTECTEDDYMNSADTKYQEIMKTYKDYEKQKQAIPLSRSVDIGFKKITDLLTSMEKQMIEDETNIDVLMISKQYIESDMNNLNSDLPKLSLLVDTKSKEAHLDELVSKAEALKRQADAKVREASSKGNCLDISSDSHNTIVYNLNDQDVSSEETGKSTSSKALHTNEQTQFNKDTSPLLTERSDESTQAHTKIPENGALAASSESFIPTLPSLSSSVKRIELPDFSGQRKDWPEFKSMFRHLAEAVIPSEQALAFELKRHVKAPADALIQSIFCTKKGAYQNMWKRLGEVYDDPGASITSALSRLYALQKPGDDFRNIVYFINEIENIYAQLEELQQLDCISIRDVDNINSLLPLNMKMEWNRSYTKLPIEFKTKPFKPFMEYLGNERAAIIRVAGPSLGTRPPRRTTMAGYAEESKRELPVPYMAM